MIHTYGPHPDQYAELTLPKEMPLGVVVVIHGGFWRAAYDASLGHDLFHDSQSADGLPTTSNTDG